MPKSNNIIKRLTALLVSIAIILTTLQLQPIKVYADNVSNAVNAIIADITGSSGAGGNLTIQVDKRKSRRTI